MSTGSVSSTPAAADLLDPFTGRPGKRAVSATVTGPSLALAKALATAVAVDDDATAAAAALDGYAVYLIRPDAPRRTTAESTSIGPVALKVGSTCYRFARYYTGAISYIRKGPPLMRLLGPFVILTSLAVLGSGVALAFSGPRNGPWLFAHKASFVPWFGCMSVHVLAYVWRLPRTCSARRARPR